jgi:hypothetical protein
MSQFLVHDGVAELQGVYGPLQVLENKVQQIWAFQDLQWGDWRTRTGDRLKVRHPGRWNRGAGPDFLEAVVELDGEARAGDVEIHLYREDWWRHGHDADPAYDSVVLHVVMFAGGMAREIRTQSGSLPAEWVMGPWTREDVESISGGAPGLFGELVPELREWLESDLPAIQRDRLRAGADRRWQDKESMARCLLDAFRWAGALHRMSLYYMGFPFNRKPFYEMAEAFPRESWENPGLVERLREEWGNSVRWRSGRPANRAGHRLMEYIQLTRTGDWMKRLGDLPEPLLAGLANEGRPFGDVRSTRTFRKRTGLAHWREWLGRGVLAGRLNPCLADRLWIDVFLPLMVVGGRLAREQAYGIWFHWQAASFPGAHRELLKLVAIQTDRRYPLCNGWVQGLLWQEDQLRLERIRTTLGAAPPPGDGSRA